MEFAPPCGAHVSDSLNGAVRMLADAGVENPRLDAEVLLAEASGRRRIDVLAGNLSLTPAMHSRFAEFLRRRVAREPLAYIIGHREFFSLDLEIAPTVLIPRPETETVVAAALDAAAEFPQGRVLDLGTGSGAVALALAMNSPKLHIAASDISEDALVIARRNAIRLHPVNPIEFVCCDLFGGLRAAKHFDLVVSNPPYVASESESHLDPEIRYEPDIALFGGIDGLGFYRRILAAAGSVLKRGGWLVLEIGAGQCDSVAALCRRSGSRNTRVHPDLAGIPRALCAQF
ncbi:MAG: peptide chain release factor N(5)-glutamine methyltransferase [Candidatus Binataceae bacterium]